MSASKPHKINVVEKMYTNKKNYMYADVGKQKCQNSKVDF